MTTNVIFAAVAVGILALACVVTWELVLTLRQTRAAAGALEQFLNGTRPRIEAVGDQIGSLVSRADGLLCAAEQGRGTAGAMLDALTRALVGWRSGVEAITTVAALFGGLVQAWSSMTKPRGAAEPAPSGGGAHE